MKVSVDSDKCQGHARCWEKCPEVFDLDDDGYAFALVEVVPVELEDRTRDAALNCPERAITVS